MFIWEKAEVGSLAFFSSSDFWIHMNLCVCICVYIGLSFRDWGSSLTFLHGPKEFTFLLQTPAPTYEGGIAV